MDLYNLYPNLFNSQNEHTPLDLQIIREQESSSNLNYHPYKDYFRYKLIDKETGRFYRYIRIPELTSNTTLIDQFNGKYDYIPAPYRKYSPRKLIWKLRVLLIMIAGLFVVLSDSFRTFLKSKFSNQLWVIIRGVVILLIAYTIWGRYGDEIINFVKNIL